MDWIAAFLMLWMTWYCTICVVPQQPVEHPWELRLRVVEQQQATSSAVADQALREAKEIIKNRTERIEELERWKREQERSEVDGTGTAAKAEEAKKTADAVAAKVEESVGKDNPWLVAFGGASGLSALLIGVIGYLTRGALKRLRAELEENESLPSNKSQASSVGGIAPMNPTGLAGTQSDGG